MNRCTKPAPSIVVDGRRGGSNLVVSAVHALYTVAEGRKIISGIYLDNLLRYGKVFAVLCKIVIL